jgi:hypothetical protein
MSSDPALRRAYLKFNDTWFAGKLPPNVVVFWEPANGNLAETFEFETLESTGGEPELGIRIDPTLRFAARLWKFTLLHEMCHVKTYSYLGHGKKFKKEMLRLANAGAFDNLW